MLQVLLVDDKETIVEGLALIIDWQSYGYEIAAKATSAREAIDIVTKQKIDLIVTDINMPVMSGLEMINEIKNISGSIKFILISGYAEFEYAKFAIDENVSGYLLKPIDENELIRVLEKIRTEFENATDYETQKKMVYLFNSLENENIEKNNIRDLTKSKNLRYVVIRDFSSDIIKLSNNKSTEINKIRDVIKHFDESKKACCFVESISAEVSIIVNFEKIETYEKLYFEEMSAAFKSANIENYEIFVGTKCTNIENISESKKSCKLIEDVFFYETEKRILIYEDYTDMKFSENIIQKSLVENIIEAVNALDENKLKTAIDVFINEITFLKVHPGTVKMYISRIVFDISNFISEKGGDALAIIYKWTCVERMSLLTHRIIYIFLMDLYEEIKNTFVNIKKRNIFGIVGDVIEYINSNYSNDKLSVNLIAQKYYITPAYLGKIFKEKTGESCKSYILKVRMEKAKKLLENTDDKIYIIATKVGFADINYFYVKFQEYEGITATQYREKNNF